MIQRKRLRRRLWLWAAGLVLGWVGVAVAQEEQADYKLSVNPSSVREDAGPTNIEVTVEVTDDTAVETDTYVLLGVSDEGFNSRFRLTLTALRIPAGKKKATGQLTFIPVDDRVVNDGGDLDITLSGNVGSGRTVEATTLTLIDDDKDSQNIHLSANIVELNRFDGATEIAVTATLDGKELRRATTFVLTIGDHPDLNATPNSEAAATKDNREAQRDLDYTVTLAPLTIPRNSVSGTATITITPKNRLPGTIRVGSPTGRVEVGDDELTIHPVDLKIKKEVAAAPDAIALSRERVREDAGATTITLNVTLKNPVVEDETVSLVVLPVGSVLPSGGTVPSTPTRDVHYTLSFGPPLVIPAGDSAGTTTFTLTPIDDDSVVARGSIYIRVAVGDVLTTKAIEIADDDATSTQIALTVEPTSISEGAGSTEVAVTGTLNGKVLDDDVVVRLTIDPDPKDTDDEGQSVDVAEATRDIDYTASLRPLTIPAGAVSGTTMITITPIDDGVVDASETIRLTSASSQVPAADGLQLTVSAVDIILRDPGEGGAPFFAAGVTIADRTYSVGAAIANLVLPEAAGGTGDLTYEVSVLPAGLSFDEVRRTLSGTPVAATDAPVTITYTATDRDGNAARRTFTIAILAEAVTVLAFAEDAAVADQTYAAGTAITDLVLPEAMGGAGDLRYHLLTLPAGLSFNGATRTLSGTPTAATNCAVEVTYMATDLNRDAVALMFSITVTAPEKPAVELAGLAVAPAVIREDAATTDLSLTVTLAAAADEDESVRFTLVEPTDGSPAVRDVNYSAVLQALIVIPAGATEGTTTLSLTPIDDAESDGPKALGVQAMLVSTGATLVTDIEIRDDEAPSTAIWLSAAPSALSEQADLTTVILTATLDGQALAADATVHLSIDEASTATRDLDYAALFTPRIEIPAGSTTGTLRFYVDPVADDLAEGEEFIRLLGAIDGLAGDAVQIVLSDSEAAKVVAQVQPVAFTLANNFPNPFNPATTIQYALPQAADVELVVYNAVGQPVRTLVAQHQHAGHYAVEWDATDDRGYSLSSGMYLYRLQAGGEFREVKKMLLLR